MDVFNDDGPVYGPNGQWELDPDRLCGSGRRPVFATCKNNCPGGELYQFSNIYLQTSADENVSLRLRKYNSRHQ